MSAFYLHHAHVNALVTYAFHAFPSYHWNHNCFGMVRSETEMGRLLLRENARSVGHRYPGDDFDYEADIAEYEHCMSLKDLSRSPVAILKLCNCYDYQSCETDDYEKSHARKIIEHLKSDAISKLTGYDAAPWAIND